MIVIATIIKIVTGPPQHKLLVWRTGNVNFIEIHRNPWNWHLRSLRSVWDCQHHADQPDTFTPSHMERWCDRGSHRTHRTVPLRENTSLNQDHIKTNRMEEFPYLMWRTKRLRTERGRVWDAPTTLMGKPWSRHQPSGIYPRHRACRSG